MKLDHLYLSNIDEEQWTLSLTGRDIVSARLDNFDRAVLADCENPHATIADKLLALELLARRIEEAEARDEKASQQ